MDLHIQFVLKKYHIESNTCDIVLFFYGKNDKVKNPVLLWHQYLVLAKIDWDILVESRKIITYETKSVSYRNRTNQRCPLMSGEGICS